MDAADVKVHERSVGRSEIRRLAKEGFVPGVLYSQGDSTPIALEYDPLKRILDIKGEAGLVLDTYYNGEPFKVVVKEVQRDPVSREIKHVDLMPADGRVLH